MSGSGLLEREDPTIDPPPPRRGEEIDGSVQRDRRRRTIQRATIAVVAIVVVVGAVVLVRARREPATTTTAPPPPPTAAAATKTITDDQTFDGTIGYAQAIPVVARTTGRVTYLAPEGAVVNPGDVVFALDEQPVHLMTGALPAWRDLGPATSPGPDVQQLNQSLVALGFDPNRAITPDQTFSAATAAAVERWQQQVGLPPTGTIPLGAIVFEPGPVTVGHQDTSVGTAVASGTGVLEVRAGGLTMQFTLPSSASVSITIGQKVDVTLPDRTNGQGTITSIGTVTDATTGDVTTVGRGPVVPANQRSAAPADQAPIKVRVSQVVGNNVLTVPAQALNAQVGGTWTVTVSDGGTATHEVPVQVGAAAGGSVAITGPGIGVGTKVVVPPTA